MNDDGLNEWGWNDWFAQQAEPGLTETLARVAAVDRDGFLLVDQTGFFRAGLAGRFRHEHPQAHEQPCVGDWVCLEKTPAGDFGVIRFCLERRTVLRRRMAGPAAGYQVVAANVDCVLIVQSCQADFNLHRLERCLVMTRDGGVDPCILLTKTDLVDRAVLADQMSAIRSADPGTPVLALSAVTREGMEEFSRLPMPGKTYCLIGSSGVGKSTLINHLLGREVQETGTLSGTGEGRHTTVRRELIRLPNGALIIDNPGMREFGILDADIGLAATFGDFSEHAGECRFPDCTHTQEPGCAVLAARESGALSEDRYQHYLKLKKESDYHALSYVEKRRKDKAFGRHVKAALKVLKK
jgi:ribosome biogenesis GTPase